MGVNKDNGVRTSSMTGGGGGGGGGGSSRIEVIEAAGTAARYRWHTGAIAVLSGCRRHVANQQDIRQRNREGWLPISSVGWCMYTLT